MNQDIPRIRRARLGEADGTLAIDWKGGGHDIIDFAGLIASDSLFAPLADSRLFAKVEVIDWGAAVSWGDGMELSGSTLARMAEAQERAAAGEGRWREHFTKVDANGDGVIDEAEIAAQQAAQFDKLDSNGDGV